MKSNFVIDAYARIDPVSASFLNNNIVENIHNEDFTAYSKKIYQVLNLNYPKFYKMDNLCKLGYLCCELLFQKTTTTIDPHTSIVLYNTNSSIDSDLKYYETISNKTAFFPSPALFVYTLPNIMIGEICIRHGITGENIVLLTEHFSPDDLYLYIQMLFSTTGTAACIGGYVDYVHGAYFAKLVFVKRKEDSINPHSLFTPAHLSDIFTSVS